LSKRDIKLFYTGKHDERSHDGFGDGEITTVTGVGVLLQNISKLLKTTIGSDSYSPNLGSDLKNFLISGRKLDEETFTTYINIALEQVQSYVILEQTSKILDAEERLLDLSLRRVTGTEASGEFLTEVLVTTAANKTFLVRL